MKVAAILFCAIIVQGVDVELNSQALPSNVEFKNRIFYSKSEHDGEELSREENSGFSNHKTEICVPEGADGVLVIHEYCNWFYQCSHGNPVAMRCPGNLLFNPRKNQCDWSHDVDCGERIIPAPDDNENGGNDNGDNGGDDENDGPVNDNPAEAPEICGREGSDGILVAHEYCNKFYKCYNGNPVTQRCPGTLLFNPRKNQCDWPHDVDCGDRIIPAPEDNDNGGNDDGNNGGDDDKGDEENGDVDDNDGPGNDNPAEAPEICGREGSDGVLVAHEYCNKFYKCYNGNPVALRCPGILLFNPRKNQCDWPHDVDCGDRIIPAPEDNDNGGNDDGNNGGDDDKGDEENGGVDDNDGPGNDNPAEAPEICGREGSDGVLVAHEYCNKFYKCYNGNPVALRCPGILLFNPRKNQCDWPHDVDCGDRIIPAPEDNDNGGNDDGNNGGDDDKGDEENGGVDDNDGPGNDNPAEAPEICGREGSDGVLVAHEYCNKFYKCYNGNPVTLRCPGILLFNPRKNQCDWPHDVDCGDRIIPAPEDNDNGGNDDGNNGGDDDKGDEENGDVDDNDGPGNDNPAEAPEICGREGSDGVLVAHEYCNKFYKCYNGNPVALRCPGILLFNPRKNQCDWPHDVDCGDRIIPAPEDNDNGGNDDGNNGGDDDKGDEENGGVDDNDGPGNDNPAEAPEICGREGSDGVLVAHEYCNKFYKCYNGNPVTLRCPGILLFNPRKNQCDWPHDVDCGDRIIPAPEDNDNGGNDDGNNGGDDDKGDEENGDVDDNDGPGNDNPAEAPEICGREGSDGILVAHEYCNKFYKCYNGNPVTLRCPGILLFNPRKNQCDWPHDVDCGDRIIPAPEDNDNGGNDDGNNGGDDDKGDEENGGVDDNDGPGNDNPAEAPEICGREGSDGILIAHEYCNLFYKCYNGNPVTLRCPGTLLFNPRKNQCDWPHDVDCGDRIIPAPEDNDNGGNDDGNNEGDDDKGDEENGDVDDNDGPGNDNPAEAPEICGREGSDGILVAHEYCNKFYKCYNGNPFTLRCPGILLFNPRKNQCDWPHDVVCGDRIIPAPEDNDNGGNDDGNNGGDDDKGDEENGGVDDNDGPGNDNPAEAPEICGREGSDGILVAHEYCNKFYKCYNGNPVTLRCPGILLFNPRKNQCDWPHDVDCGDRIIPAPEDNDNGGNDDGNNGGDDDKGDEENGDVDDNDGPGNDNPAEAPEICGREGSDGILVAHEYCNLFYKCYNGNPVTLRCPGILLFNPRKNQCDWSHNVDCGDRIIPASDDNGVNDNDDNKGDDNIDGPVNDNPAEAPEICAREGSDGVLVAHEYCNQFYICSNGKLFALICPGDLLYNPRKGQCDWPVNVICAGRIVTV